MTARDQEESRFSSFAAHFFHFGNLFTTTLLALLCWRGVIRNPVSEGGEFAAFAMTVTATLASGVALYGWKSGRKSVGYASLVLLLVAFYFGKHLQ
ncbi:hypothetical protein [Streptomyces sp. ODS28]|uniref:hypothetical protein n=1 Tax=Streptomyces sp. ODS28 TaxID=3136688 RepID=UPI0031E95FF6